LFFVFLAFFAGAAKLLRAVWLMRDCGSMWSPLGTSRRGLSTLIF